MNGISLTSRPIAGSGANGGGRIMEMETDVNNELVEVGGFVESDRGLVRKSWVDGSEERMWKLSLRICLRWWRPE